MKKYLILLLSLSNITMPQLAFAGDFSFGFDWGPISKCSSGYPGRVVNPHFKFANVPENTATIKMTMSDLNVPQFNHGGGTITYAGKNNVGPGSFKYAQPCPPSGSHIYIWTATAYDGKGKRIATAKARKKYP